MHEFIQADAKVCGAECCRVAFKQIFVHVIYYLIYNYCFYVSVSVFIAFFLLAKVLWTFSVKFDVFEISTTYSTMNTRVNRNEPV